jgi:hypothetical protein
VPSLSCTQVGPGSPGSCKRCVVLSPHNAQCWALRGAVKGQVDLVETVDKMQVGFAGMEGIIWLKNPSSYTREAATA